MTTKKTEKKNLTIAITQEEEEQLLDLMAYFQQESIKKVKRSDIIRYLLSRYHLLVKSGKMDEVFKEVERILDDEK